MEMLGGQLFFDILMGVFIVIVLAICIYGIIKF